ncbi:MAG: ISL3 family transposase, partial [Leptospira sp.]|nr:ISL3 family transposase [Leptospira sp.]
MVLSFRFSESASHVCPKCGGSVNSFKSKNETIKIHAESAFGFPVLLEFPRYRVNHSQCGYPYLKLPDIVHPEHRITKDYSEFIYELCKVMTLSNIEKLTGISDSLIRDLDFSMVKEKVEARKIENLKTVGLDEIQSGKGHQYFHIIYEMDQEEVLHVGEGRKKVDLAPFLWKYRKYLGNVEWMVMDFWDAFTNVFSRFCKNGKIIHDHFHIKKHLNEALDKLRKIEFKKAKENQEHEVFFRKKWLLLKNRINLLRKQRTHLKELLSVNRRLLKAYLLKEEFSRFWKFKKLGNAKRFWKSWKQSLRWQRLKPLQEFSAMFDRHSENIFNTFRRKEPLKMGYIEGSNNKIKTLIRQHYGYRNNEYLKLKIIQSCSKSLKGFQPLYKP